MLAEARQARDRWLDELYLAQRCKDEARQLACRYHLDQLESVIAMLLRAIASRAGE
jgi:hypothetical protein